MSNQPEYSEEERAAAWAAYYAQQGYDAAPTSTATSAYSQETTPTPGYDAQGYAIRNGSSSNATASSSTNPIYDTQLLQQSSVYMPGAAQELAKTHKYKMPGKRETVVRKGNGRTWEDPTLLDWDPKWWRLFVGDLSNDVNERTLDKAFEKYPSYCKCKVVRDRLSEKAKYGFIAFKDPEDFLKAWKEMDGKYVGNRPITLTKVKDDKYGSIATVAVGGRKAKNLDKLRKNHGKPLDGRPVPW
ncbi:RNA-binding protein 42, partial [Tremellales sp. Uapishka_1]